MVSSKAKTVGAYLGELAPDRRAVVEEVLALVRASMPKGFDEVMQYGMISWVVPDAKLSETYNDQPLAVAALAAQKNYVSLYLLGAYMDPKRREALEKAFAVAGKKLDMGESCLRFKSTDEIDMKSVGAALASLGVDDLVALYKKSRGKG
jgi:Domain of unknown function (DU1801)